MSGHRHRAGGLHQENKKFKGSGGHSSNRQVKRRAGAGKAAGGPRSSVKSHHGAVAGAKDARRNRAKQVMDKKRAAVIASKRTGSAAGPPRTVAVVPLGSGVDTASVLAGFAAGATTTRVSAAAAPLGVTAAAGVSTHVFVEPRVRLTMIDVASRGLLDVLDACKVADVVLFVIPADGGVDGNGDETISAIKAQGMPSYVTVIQGLHTMAAKDAADARKHHMRYFFSQFPDDDRSLIPVDDMEAALPKLLRHLSTMKLRSLAWRDATPYMATHAVSWDGGEAGNDPTAVPPETLGQLHVWGYLRGGVPLTTGVPAHITGVGDFVAGVAAVTADPYVAWSDRGDASLLAQSPYNDPGEIVATREVAEAEGRAEGMDTLNEIDPFAAEQSAISTDEMGTDPTDEAPVLRRRPRGWSQYQASWLDVTDPGFDPRVQDADAAGNAMQTGDEEHVMYDGANLGFRETGVGGVEDDEEYVEEEVGASGEPLDEDEIDGRKSKEELQAERKADLADRRAERAAEDLEFPDEIDTPVDQPARKRFARYRGLKSFRTSPWDVNESLPPAYGRVYGFENFMATSRRMAEAAAYEEDAIGADQWVRLTLFNVPAGVLASWPGSRVMIVTGLRRNECKTSVLHFMATRSKDYTAPVRSKEPLLVGYGWRRYATQPVYSDYHPDPTEKCKMQRWFHAGAPMAMSFYGPLQYGPAPMLSFKPSGPGGSLELVASGSMLTVDPDRLLIKRIVLSGFPYKLHKKSARVRFMFFNRNDVRYFAPVELWTKHGHVGHIKESVGTHGRMKCLFDQPIAPQDTVCMSLYKRVFPVWPRHLADPSTAPMLVNFTNPGYGVGLNADLQPLPEWVDKIAARQAEEAAAVEATMDTTGRTVTMGEAEVMEGSAMEAALAALPTATPVL